MDEWFCSNFSRVSYFVGFSLYYKVCIPIVFQSIYVLFCAIWYHLYDLKKMKNTNKGVLLSAEACNFTKSKTTPWVHFTLFKIMQMVLNSSKRHIHTPLFSRKWDENVFGSKISSVDILHVSRGTSGLNISKCFSSKCSEANIQKPKHLRWSFFRKLTAFFESYLTAESRSLFSQKFRS